MNREMDVDSETLIHSQDPVDNQVISPPPSCKFRHQQLSELFGISLDVDLISSAATSPELIPELGAYPSLDMAIVKHKIRVSSLFPSFAGTPLDFFYLENVVFTRQNFSSPGKYVAGLHLDGDLKIDKACAELHSVLANVLGVQDPGLHLHGRLDYTFDWWSSLDISSFTLEGTFDDINMSIPLTGIKMTDLGARILGYKVMSYDEKGQLALGREYGYALFGAFDIQASTWKSGISLTFEIAKLASHLQLSAVANVEWENAFDVQGLTLCDVGVSAELTTDKSISTATFAVHATLELIGIDITLAGSFSLGGDFSVLVELENLDWQAINGIYEQFFGEKLSTPDVEFSLERGTLMISNEGLEVEIYHLAIEEFPPANGTLKMSTHGMLIDVAIDGPVTIDEFIISNPHVKISCFKVNGSFKSDVIVSGTFTWEGFALKLDLHLYTSPEPGDNSLEYTLCGQFMLKNPAAGLRFDEVIPALKACSSLGSVTLDGAAVVVASRELSADSTPSAIPVAYPVRKGFFICAIIGNLDVISSIAGGRRPQLSLAAGWSKGKGFMVAIRADDLSIDLGGGIKTEPAELKVVFSNQPALHVCCGVKVPIEGQAEALLFSMDCALEPVGGEVTLTGSMLGMWENPFGLSKKLKIGNVLLSVTMLIAAGTPSGFCIAGDLQCGSTFISAKLFIGKEPGETFIHFVVEELGAKEIAQLASVLIGCTLREPPDVIRFRRVELYACPTPTTILGKTYPRGFCFHAVLTIFGKTAEAKVVFRDDGLVIEGAMDEFSLGPLRVRGVGEQKASIEARLTTSEQVGYIRGTIEVLGAQTTLEAFFQLQPYFLFDFYYFVTLDNLWSLKVSASLQSTVNTQSVDISNQQYRLSATFEQKILSQLRTTIQEYLQKAADEVAHQAQQIQDGIDREKESLRSDARDLACSIDRWANKDTLTSGETDDLMTKLEKLVKENIRLHPENFSQDVAEEFRRRANSLRAAKVDFDNFASEIDKIWKMIEEGAKQVPVIGESAVGKLFTGLVNNVGTATARTLTHIDGDKRRRYKECEIRCLEEQFEMMNLLMKLVPDEMKWALERPTWNIEETLRRERNNDVFDDVAEEFESLFRGLIGVLAQFVVNMASELGALLLDAAKLTVAVTSKVLQTTLKFASFLANALDLFAICYVHLFGSLGGPERKTGTTFEAIVKACICGVQVDFYIRLDIDDFQSFIKELFKEIYEECKARSSGDGAMWMR